MGFPSIRPSIRTREILRPAELRRIFGMTIGEGMQYARAKIQLLLEDFCFMSDENARQKAEHHYYAALDLVMEGEQEGALAEYRISIDIDPTFTEAMHGMAKTLQDMNRLDEAIAVAYRIAELDPDDILAHTSLSVCYQKKGMIPEAEAEGNKARVLGWKQQLKKSGS